MHISGAISVHLHSLFPRILKNFETLGISDLIVKALTENRINSPSEMQTKAIPILLQNGTDFIGQMQSGPGKTVAFSLPLLQLVNPGSEKIQAVILSPSRELCQQIAKQLFTFTKYLPTKIFVESVFGGVPIDTQINRLQKPTHILVATPDRLIDLLEAKAIDLSQVKIIVLDEADEMLKKGAKEELDRILQSMKNKKTTWLFFATMSSEIKAIIDNYMSKDAFRL